MFETIFQYFVERGELHKKKLYDLRFFGQYLEDQNEYTKERMRATIQQFNYETIKPDEEGGTYPKLEFWRGVDDYGTSVALDYDGGVDIIDNLPPLVKGQWDNAKQPSNEERIEGQKRHSAVKIDLQKYPISLLGYFEYHFRESALYYAWISYLWQEIEGQTCGLKVSTLQNNSVEQFSLVDFLDEAFSKFCESDYGKKPPRVKQFFPRKLTLIELFLRASQSSYPFNPYQNHWRYFEKDGTFLEMVTYDCATGIRSGELSECTTAAVEQMEQHENPKAVLAYITKFTNKAIFNGWEEKFRPVGLPHQMHDKAYDFSYWTGIYWYSKEQKNRIPRVRILDFAGRYGLQLPPAFIEYLRLFNGREHNKHSMHFPINDLRTVQVERFYPLNYLKEEVAAVLRFAPDFLQIGQLHGGGFLYIGINPKAETFGQMAVQQPEKQLEVCDYSFEKFAQYAQSAPVYPEIFAAQENDAAFLRKRLAEGWDATTSYSYQTAIEEAASHNAYEALEVLLQHGLRLRVDDHRKITWDYDAKTMDILDKYPKK